MSEPSDDQARHRVRRLLLSGDNTVKNRDDADRYRRARERYREARRIAVSSGLDDGVLTVIDRRLTDLGEEGGGAASTG
jgi:hypothetical protein